ncbi:MAG: PQQ-binding-like beta-propeller repeat protein [Sphingomonas sp.]|uniref:outer membrane protein assembly factor BamB family protein n=1 Tax=Sphingomonas sp. TaxID=28214 RepID=UPI001B2CE629|nr:PQQ-binding-like beta-propeller repeat protein [Sphingomonas sp.]MBO9623565.1 PQQ-binding-like beta-propeller repeat protein [Sphingomonas sp.]
MSKWAGNGALAALCWMLAGCSGGGGGSVVTPQPSPTPTPSVAVTLSVDSQSVVMTEDGSGGPIAFDATVTGLPATTVIADAQFDHTQLALQGGTITQGAGGVYQVRLQPLATLEPGNYSGAVTFRLCGDAACSNVYAGSAKTFTYQLTVRLGDWKTFQRNAGHDGYVRAAFDPAAFKKAWDYVPAGVTRITTVASSGDRAYVTTFGSDGTTTVRALATSTGEQRWFYNVGQTSYTSAPAAANGKVFVTSMVSSSSNNSIIALDAETGQFAGPTAPFASQWSFFLPPTAYDQGLYMSAGYFGSVVYGFDYAKLQYWSFDANGSIWDGETPAVDADNVYYYSGAALQVIDRNSGALKKSIPDPFFQSNGYSYYGAPILGSNGNVLAYSGQRGSASSSVLVDWSIANGAYAWRSADTYTTSPAVAGGMVYLARNNPGRFDALSEATGAIQWSWTPPAGEQFIFNTVATKNLVFVSTDKAIYALPTQGSNHAPVWTAPTGGEMAITADGMLIVANQRPGTVMPSTLVAYRLY